MITYKNNIVYYNNEKLNIFKCDILHNVKILLYNNIFYETHFDYLDFRYKYDKNEKYLTTDTIVINKTTILYKYDVLIIHKNMVYEYKYSNNNNNCFYLFNLEKNNLLTYSLNRIRIEKLKSII